MSNKQVNKPEESYPPSLLLDMYRKMLVIRFFNERQAEETMQGKLYGYIHLYSGQEGVAVGAISALSREDKITSTHRAEGHLIAAGVSLKGIMAEVYGKVTGLCGGKGGPMGMADFDSGVISAYEIVGSGIPVATGAAWGYKMLGTQQVVACFFGDGAANQGVLYECLNQAALWKIPVIFICENNGYAVDTSLKAAFAVQEIAPRSEPFGVPGIVVDGTDVMEMYRVTQKAVARARAGEGPTFIEAQAVRWVGHHQADSQWYYRTKDEVEEVKKGCPIKKLRQYLVDQSLLTEEADARIQDEILEDIEEAVRFAEESEWPQKEEMHKNLYVENGGPYA